MVAAFCPGHITCFFQPSEPKGADLLARGSRGAGIRISAGSEVVMEERPDDRVTVTIDGAENAAPVTRHVLSQMLPGRGFDIIVSNDVPTGEGFGMSASGAIAAAMCAASVLGGDIEDVYENAHRAEILGGGGLGDVSAISSLAHLPVRVSAGLPPKGRVIDAGFSFDRLTLAVLGPKMNTGRILGDPRNYNAIVSAGAAAMERFLKYSDRESLFAISNIFSSLTGVESPEVSEAIKDLGARGIRAGMCMLGNSIFADAPADEVASVLGDAAVFECRSTDEPPRLTRRE